MGLERPHHNSWDLRGITGSCPPVGGGPRVQADGRSLAEPGFARPPIRPPYWPSGTTSRIRTIRWQQHVLHAGSRYLIVWFACIWLGSIDRKSWRKVHLVVDVFFDRGMWACVNWDTMSFGFTFNIIIYLVSSLLFFFFLFLLSVTFMLYVFVHFPFPG